MATKQLKKHELAEAIVEVVTHCLSNGDFLVIDRTNEPANRHIEIEVDVGIVQGQLADYDIQVSREEIISVIKGKKIALTVPEE